MKTSLSSFITLFALSTALLSGTEPASKTDCCATPPEEIKKPEAGACCQPATEPVATEPDACCAEAPPAAPYSRTSLYQLDARFTNDAGETFALGDLRGQPVVVDMFFASCGYACPLTVTNMLAIQGRLPVGQRDKVRFVLVSFDVVRDTTAELAKYRATRGLDDQWILLRGDDNSVRELAALLGVKYKQEADGMFSHSNLLTVLNPKGEIMHQREGLNGGLDEVITALAAATQ
ncbi:MAG: SCO family protein [Cephaloticoccus sp.]|nr:SCO family protein [Cephaloticoccus sp.]MCF7759817.1 SCO family protein [Cephaloticoccus sp.]